MSEMDQIVDVTFTVRASEANGRRLMKDMGSGTTFWVVDEAGSAEDTPAVPPEVKKPVRRKKK